MIRVYELGQWPAKGREDWVASFKPIYDLRLALALTNVTPISANQKALSESWARKFFWGLRDLSLGQYLEATGYSLCFSRIDSRQQGRGRRLSLQYPSSQAIHCTKKALPCLLYSRALATRVHYKLPALDSRRCLALIQRTTIASSNSHLICVCCITTICWF